jgi:hypothetical protein
VLQHAQHHRIVFHQQQLDVVGHESSELFFLRRTF